MMNMFKTLTHHIGCRWLPAVLVLLLIPISSQAADPFPAAQAFAGQNLTLNGKGIRAKLIFNLYTAGLYLPAANNDANAILAGNQPKAMRLQVTSRTITSENMEEAVREGFQKSAGASLAALQPRIEQLITVFKEEIKDGDIYDFIYRPQNTVIVKNGRNAATIAGADFQQAFYGIWLGANPVDKKLKAALLGS